MNPAPAVVLLWPSSPVEFWVWVGSFFQFGTERKLRGLGLSSQTPLVPTDLQMGLPLCLTARKPCRACGRKFANRVVVTKY